MRKLCVFPLLVMLLWPLSSLAAEITRIDIVDYGIGAPQNPDRTKVEGRYSTHGPKTTFKITEKTDRIPIKSDINFGFVYTLTGSPLGAEVKVEQHLNAPHEKMKGTVGHKIGPRTFFIYCGVAENYPPGKYELSVTYGDKVSAKKTFTLYRLENKESTSEKTSEPEKVPTDIKEKPKSEKSD